MDDEWTKKHFLAMGARALFRGLGEAPATCYEIVEVELPSDGVGSSWRKIGQPMVLPLNKRTSKLTPGTVYSIETDGASFRVAGAAWVALWPDGGEREAMAAAHRASTVSLNKAKAQDKLRKAAIDLDETLAYLRIEYQKLTTGDAKIAFELAVLASLRKRS